MLKNKIFIYKIKYSLVSKNKIWNSNNKSLNCKD